MFISRNWLNDYVDCLDLGADEFRELVTTRVAEVDRIHLAAHPVAAAVVVAISSVEPHPSKPNLVVATVSNGSAEIQVVCGAPNCQTGMLTAYVSEGNPILVPGTGEQRIVEVREVAGLASHGVLVSEAELGLSGDHSGIFDLGDSALKLLVSANAGMKLSELVGDPDLVIEIDNKSLTHRPDLWGHLGFAFELSALLNRPLKLPARDWTDEHESGQLALKNLGVGSATSYRVQIEPSTLSKRFTGLLIEGVHTEPSPLWMRRRLFAVGGGVRNLLIDLSNYVMRDVGQPNHAYDADVFVGPTIFVRNGKSGETFEALDGVSYNVTDADVVIADGERVVGLGGVMGGARCSVRDETKRLLVESAHFDPVLIRKTMKRHAIRTDASNRFEKNRSPHAAPLALHRFWQLLHKLQPAAKVSGAVVDCCPERPAKVTVSATFDYIRNRLGKEVPDQEISRILTSLRFEIAESKDGSFTALVPAERSTRDISIADDLVEEVGRIIGYENVPESAPMISSVSPMSVPVKRFEEQAREVLRALGFSETYHYSFANREEAKRFGYDLEETFTLENPVDSENSILRPSLVPGLLSALDRNARYFEGIALFEIGRSYRRPTNGVEAYRPVGSGSERFAGIEKRLLAIAYSSGRSESELRALSQPQLAQGGDFYAVVNVLSKLLAAFGITDVRLRAFAGVDSKQPATAQAAWMHPYRSAQVFVGEQLVGVIAEVRKGFTSELRQRALMAEIDIDMLSTLVADAEHFKALPKFPESYFEVSVVMPERDEYLLLTDLIGRHCPSFLRGIELLDVYQGAPLEGGTKSVSVRMRLGADDHTLDSDEMTSIQDGIVDGIRQSAYSLRG